METAIIKAKLMEIKREMDQLLENEQINSSKVYQLSVRLDKVIIDFYKSNYSNS